GIREDLVTGVQTCALPIWFLLTMHSPLPWSKYLPATILKSGRNCLDAVSWTPRMMMLFREPFLRSPLAMLSSSLAARGAPDTSRSEERRVGRGGRGWWCAE